MSLGNIILLEFLSINICRFYIIKIILKIVFIYFLKIGIVCIIEKVK